MYVCVRETKRSRAHEEWIERREDRERAAAGGDANLMAAAINNKHAH